MTPTREDFLRKIADNPECDVTRGVYADWLQENGEEDLAEFVRVQVEMATVAPVRNQSANEWPPRWSELWRREKELIAKHPEWLPVCTNCEGHHFRPGQSCPHCHQGRVGRFERGLLTRVPVAYFTHLMAAPDLSLDPEYGPTPWLRELLKAHPLVERIGVDEFRPWVEPLGGEDEVGWWEAGNPMTDEDDIRATIPRIVFRAMWDEYPGARQEDHLGRWMLWDSADDAVTIFEEAVAIVAKRLIEENP